MADTSPSWSGLAAQYVRSHRTASRDTRAAYRYVLMDFAAFAVDAPLTAAADELVDLVDRWLERRRWAPTTMCTNLGILRPFLEWAARRGAVTGGVASQLRNPRKPQPLPRALSDRQVAQLLAVVPDARAQAMALLEAQCGLRRAEVAAIMMSDVDFLVGTIRVHGKGGIDRIVYPSTETMEAIRQWLIHRGNGPGALICPLGKRLGQRYTPTWLGVLMSRWMEDAGLKTAPGDGVSGHALRHTCATTLLRSGVNVRVVQEAMGHASIQTTARYLRADSPEVRAAMTALAYGTRRLRAVEDTA